MKISERVIELLAKADPMRPNEFAEALNNNKKDLDYYLNTCKISPRA